MPEKENMPIYDGGKSQYDTLFAVKDYLKGEAKMKPSTKENVLQFLKEVKPSWAVRSWRVADLYDWLGGRSRIPSYYKMLGLPINQRDKVIDRIYNRQYGAYRKKYIQWSRQIFSPFLYQLTKEGEVKAASGRYGQCEFFEFKEGQQNDS